jgi:hypothetical protein
MLKITASLAGGIPVDLRDTLTALDDLSIQLLVIAIHRAAGGASGSSFRERSRLKGHKW